MFIFLMEVIINMFLVKFFSIYEMIVELEDISILPWTAKGKMINASNIFNVFKKYYQKHLAHKTKIKDNLSLI